VLALMNCASLSPISTACYPGILKHRCSSLDAHIAMTKVKAATAFNVNFLENITPPKGYQLIFELIRLFLILLKNT